MDYEKIKEGVRLMLEGIGEDVNREGLLETPDRIARMCAEIYGGLYEDPAVHLKKQFAAEGSGMVIEKDITFYSMCEHHLRIFPERKSSGAEQAGAYRGRVCPQASDSGKDDGADRGGAGREPGS